MKNINNSDPKLILINEFTIFESGSIMFGISYCEESNTPYIVFKKSVFLKKVELIVT